jgi:hypothetical protein
LQISKRLTARQLGEFQQVVGTKLGGLRNLVASCARHAGSGVDFHILTSAFSAMGNDGQPDYGAANEALAALACTRAAPGRWTALGWLGWAAVGMTRGSEYAALGNARGLRPVLPEEGKQLFLQMMESEIPSPALTLLSEGEIRFYRLPIAREVSPASDAGRGAETLVLEFPRSAAPVPAARGGDSPIPSQQRKDKIVLDFPLSLTTAGYLRDHMVNGSPALPGTFEVEFALRAARALRPEHPHVAARNPRFHRFVRVPGRGTSLRAEARLVAETADQCVIGVRLLSDFVHESGAVLKRDVLHFEGEVLTSAKPFVLTARRTSQAPGAVPCADPYLAPGSPVKLGGMFACLHDIRVGRDQREARYRIDPAVSLDSLGEFISPVLLLDALFRLVGVAPDGDVTTGAVSVPLSGESFYFASGLTDATLQGTSLRMFAASPRSEGEFLRTEWGHVLDADGRPIVSIKGALAKRMTMPASLASAL